MHRKTTAALLAGLAVSVPAVAEAKVSKIEASRLTHSLTSNPSVAESIFTRPLTAADIAIGLRGDRANDEAIDGGIGTMTGACKRANRSVFRCPVRFQGFFDGSLVRTINTTVVVRSHSGGSVSASVSQVFAD